MGRLGVVLALSSITALGVVIGGVIAEVFPISRKTINLAFHAAAGILFAFIGIELMPPVLGQGTTWQIIAAFIAGGLCFIGIDRTLDFIGEETGEEEARAAGRGKWAIYIGVGFSFFIDGVMIATGAAVSRRLALLFMIAQTADNVPLGFGTMANFKMLQRSAVKRLALTLVLALPVYAGALLSFSVLPLFVPEVRFVVIAFTAGMLLAVTVEEVVKSAHRYAATYWETVCLVAGFALFAWISVYVK
jgi:ZIP family zinc transporter